MNYFLLAVCVTAAVPVLEAAGYAGITRSDATALRLSAFMLYGAAVGLALDLQGLSFGLVLAIGAAIVGHLLVKGLLWLFRAIEQPDEQAEFYQRGYIVH